MHTVRQSGNLLCQELLTHRLLGRGKIAPRQVTFFWTEANGYGPAATLSQILEVECARRRSDAHVDVL